MNLNFVNSIKGDIQLQLSGKMTIKEMVDKYCSKIEESPENLGKNIHLVYQSRKLKINSDEKLYDKFRTNDTIIVIYDNIETEESLEKKNEEILNKINKRQKRIRKR